MKALSVRQPWAWLIVAGFKDIENRTWPTAFRGRIYVHAGQQEDRGFVLPVAVRLPKAAMDKVWRLWQYRTSNPTQFGAIVGEVDIVDCVTESTSPWFENVGAYGFVLRNPRAYAVPIPMRGMLGLFDVTLPMEATP